MTSFPFPELPYEISRTMFLEFFETSRIDARILSRSGWVSQTLMPNFVQHSKHSQNYASNLPSH
jgi:hypothetical protein